MMELRHLRYFVTVAEELHFTRAAARLGIRQPPLSQQIRQLEDEIGGRLFHRQTRGVTLTESGALMLEEARRILAQVERMTAAVRSRARGESGRLTIGFASATYFHPMVIGILRAYRAAFPAVSLVPEQDNSPRLIEALRDDGVDLAFVRVTDADGLIVEPLVAERLVAVLPADHPLAGRPAVALAALADETVILFPRTASPALYDTIITGCQQAGFSPRLGQYAPLIASIVPMVAAGFGVSLVPESVCLIQATGVVYRPLEGETPCAAIGIAWRRDDGRVTVRNFVGTARRVRRAG